MNFTKFIPAIESGDKPLTIRDTGKRDIYPQQTLHLYTAMRTRKCRPLNVPPFNTHTVKCRAVLGLRVQGLDMYVGIPPERVGFHQREMVGCFNFRWVRMTPAEKRNLQTLDGFEFPHQFYRYHFTAQSEEDRELIRKRLYIFNALPDGAFSDLVARECPQWVQDWVTRPATAPAEQKTLFEVPVRAPRRYVP